MTPPRTTLPFRPGGRFPSTVIATASRALQTALSGTTHPRWFVERCICPGGQFEVIRVDYRHRLVRTDPLRQWRLIRHQRYDKIRA